MVQQHGSPWQPGPFLYPASDLIVDIWTTPTSSPQQRQTFQGPFTADRVNWSTNTPTPRAPTALVTDPGLCKRDPLVIPHSSLVHSRPPIQSASHVRHDHVRGIVKNFPALDPKTRSARVRHIGSAPKKHHLRARYSNPSCLGRCRHQLGFISNPTKTLESSIAQTNKSTVSDSPPRELPKSHSDEEYNSHAIGYTTFFAESASSTGHAAARFAPSWLVCVNFELCRELATSQPYQLACYCTLMSPTRPTGRRT